MGSSWLRNVAYRTRISIEIFLISSLILGVIAATTVVILSIRAALSNPVDSIRYE
ncbi:MAG: hypothetical protein BMS9Abin05_0048 [Rhodothermia bacterium]|nr:MAG: hypothetical protein BMS9Abin05_0048 [Rhodothermia bacterium]